MFFKLFFDAWQTFTNKNSRATPPNENIIHTLRLFIQYIMTEVNLFTLTQCETRACLVEHKADILAGIEERPTRSSSSRALSRYLFLVFIAVMLGKLSSHRYVVEKGSNVEIALFVRIGNSLAAVNQNCPKVDQQGSALKHDHVLSKNCCWAIWVPNPVKAISGEWR